MSRVYTGDEEQWLRENYSASGNIADTVEAFAARFGHKPTKQALQQKAYKMGLRKGSRAGERKVPATVRMRWSDPANADKLAWMLEHDQTESVYVTIDAFEREFGIRLNRNQVVTFRQTRGLLRRRSHGGGREPRPLGSELPRKDGYIYVKVRERPTVPGTRDNWELKQHVVYREANGLDEIPEDCTVYFANRDITDFSPENLVLVPRRYIGCLNNPDLPDYHDAESLKACMAWIDLHRAVAEAERSAPRTCRVCGREFVEDEKMRRAKSRSRTCRSCLDARRKGQPDRKGKGKR